MKLLPTYRDKFSSLIRFVYKNFRYKQVQDKHISFYIKGPIDSHERWVTINNY